MITLQYFDGKKWIDCGKWQNETLAWVSLGTDNFNYRTIDENGKVLTDMSLPEYNPFKKSIKEEGQ